MLGWLVSITPLSAFAELFVSKDVAKSKERDYIASPYMKKLMKYHGTDHMIQTKANSDLYYFIRPSGQKVTVRINREEDERGR